MDWKITREYSKYFILQLVLITTVIALAITAILFNNSLRSAPIFILFLAMGIASQAALGFKRGGLLALLFSSGAIMIKQFIGSWTGAGLALNLTEVLLMTGAFLLTGRYHDALLAYFHDFENAKQKLKVLDLEDISVGLIRPAIGMLRLREEADRALRFRRPVALVLILATVLPGQEEERQAAMRSVATTVKDTTRILDIPFLLSEGKIALILPDTEINGTNTVIGNLQRKFLTSRVIARSGRLASLQNVIRIRIGYAVFLGYGTRPFDLLDAAEKSLQRNVEMNAGAIFQNLFIDWEPLGETPSVQTILLDKNDIVGLNEPVFQSIENKPEE